MALGELDAGAARISSRRNGRHDGAGLRTGSPAADGDVSGDGQLARARARPRGLDRARARAVATPHRLRHYAGALSASRAPWNAMHLSSGAQFNFLERRHRRPDRSDRAGSAFRRLSISGANRARDGLRPRAQQHEIRPHDGRWRPWIPPTRQVANNLGTEAPKDPVKRGFGRHQKARRDNKLGFSNESAELPSPVKIRTTPPAFARLGELRMASQRAEDRRRMSTVAAKPRRWTERASYRN